MPTNDTVKTLIDKAAANLGSDASVARAIGVVPQRIANWRNGSATCSPEDQALIATLAGLDPLIELARATVRKHEGTAKGDLLMKALGKPLLAIGAAIGSAGAGAHPIGSMIRVSAEFIQCILC